MYYLNKVYLFLTTIIPLAAVKPQLAPQSKLSVIALQILHVMK